MTTLRQGAPNVNPTAPAAPGQAPADRAPQGRATATLPIPTYCLPTAQLLGSNDAGLLLCRIAWLESRSRTDAYAGTVQGQGVLATSINVSLRTLKRIQRNLQDREILRVRRTGHLSRYSVNYDAWLTAFAPAGMVAPPWLKRLMALRPNWFVHFDAEDRVRIMEAALGQNDLSPPAQDGPSGTRQNGLTDGPEWPNGWAKTAYGIGQNDPEAIGQNGPPDRPSQPIAGPPPAVAAPPLPERTEYSATSAAADGDASRTRAASFPSSPSSSDDDDHHQSSSGEGESERGPTTAAGIAAAVTADVGVRVTAAEVDEILGRAAGPVFAPAQYVRQAVLRRRPLTQVQPAAEPAGDAEVPALRAFPPGSRELWGRVLAALEGGGVARPSFETFLRGTVGVEGDGVMLVAAPTRYIAEYLSARMRGVLERALWEEAQRAMPLEFCVVVEEV